MNVVLYMDKMDEEGRRLLTAVKASPSSPEPELHLSIGGLRHRLRCLVPYSCVLILKTSTQEALLRILELGGFLRDHRTILVLPDRDKSTLSLAHTLYPRYATFQDSDFHEIPGVLNRMLGSEHAVENTPRTEIARCLPDGQTG